MHTFGESIQKRDVYVCMFPAFPIQTPGKIKASPLSCSDLINLDPAVSAPPVRETTEDGIERDMCAFHVSGEIN